MERGLRAFNASGPTAFIDLLVRLDAIHPDFLMSIQPDLPNAGEWRGIAGFYEMARNWLEVWDEFKVYPLEVIELSEGRFLVPVKQRAVAKGSGMEIGGEFFYTMEFRDGRVSHIGLYADRSPAERALEGD